MKLNILLLMTGNALLVWTEHIPKSGSENTTSFLNISGFKGEQHYIHVKRHDLNPRGNDLTSFEREAPGQKLEDRLENFTKHLKGFILETAFDVNGFEASGDQFQRERSLILASFKRLGIYTNAIHKQVKYTKRMFGVMVSSIELLKYYESSEMEGSHFLCAVIDARVRIMTLNNSYGEPDFHIEGLAIKVFSYINYLKLLRNGVEASDSMSFGARKMFYRQLTRAQKVLERLSQNFPGKTSQ